MLIFEESDKQKYFEENYWEPKPNSAYIHIFFHNFINLYCTFTHTTVTYFTVTSN